MSAVSYDSVRRAVQRADFAPVYYLTGDEETLKDELVRAVVDEAVDEGSLDFNFDARIAGDLNVESLTTLVETPPMLADRRVAVIRGIEQWRKNSKVWQALLAYVQRPSPTTILLLVAGAGHTPDKRLAENSVTVLLTTPDRDTALEWAVRRAARLQLTLTADAVNHLIDAVGGNLSHAAVEIDKLAAAVENDRPVETSDIEQFVGVRHGETVSDWVDAVARREPNRAIRLLDIVLAQPGNSAVKLLTALGSTFLAARFTRALADQRKSARQVKDALWGFLKSERPRGIGRYSDEIDRWMAVARVWRSSELDGALKLMYETDERLKTTTISDPKATLTTLLLRLPSPKGVA